MTLTLTLTMTLTLTLTMTLTMTLTLTMTMTLTLTLTMTLTMTLTLTLTMTLTMTLTLTLTLTSNLLIIKPDFESYYFCLSGKGLFQSNASVIEFIFRYMVTSTGSTSLITPLAIASLNLPVSAIQAASSKTKN